MGRAKEKTVGFLGCIILGAVIKLLYNIAIAPHTKRKRKLSTFTVASILRVLSSVSLPKGFGTKEIKEKCEDTYEDIRAKIKRS